MVALFTKYSTYLKNLTTYFGASLIPMLLSLVTNPLVAENMDPEDYAISGYYSSFSSLIGPIIIFYIIHYYIKEYFRRNEEERLKLFAIIAKASIWFSGLVSVLCLIVLFIYLKFFNPGFSFPIFPYLAFMVFSLPLTGLFSLEQARNRMNKDSKSFFKLSVYNSLISIALLVLLVVIFKWGAFGKLLSPLIGNLIVFIFLGIRYIKVWKIKTTLQEFKPVFIFCLPMALSAMLGYFTNGFTVTFLESIGDVTEYGIYIVGNSIASYLLVFSNAFGNTFQPDLYESVIKNQWRRYFKVCAILILAYSVVALIFIVLAPFIISILTAGRYVSATGYARIIALSTISSGIYSLVNNFTISTNHPKLYLYTSILGGCFMILLMPVAINKWSFYGGAWMSVISFIAYGIINIGLLALVRFKLLPKSIG